MTSPLLTDEAGRVELLLGNEAIVRGAVEAGVGFATGYPGTPSSEVTDTFAAIHDDLGIPFEYAVNEKVCLELAFGASLAGARSICAMKHLGLMAAGDPISTIPYMGVEAGMVVVSAGDPSCLTSPNEQDQRHLGRMLHFPVLDPSTPQEALDLTRAAFALSEDCKLPVLLRITTRAAHCRAPVQFGERQEHHAAGFERNPASKVPIPAHARRMRVEIKQRMATAQAWSESLFERSGSGTTAIVAAGVPAATTADLLAEFGAGDGIVFVRLPCVHPLPEEALTGLLDEVDQVLVIEELSPFIEDGLRVLASKAGSSVRILGKGTGHLPEEFEYTPAVLAAGLHAALGIGGAPTPPAEFAPTPVRPPTLCPSCPHRSTFFAARAAFGDEAVYASDIGCYTLGFSAPLNAGDVVLCMGAGYSLAAAVARVSGKRTVGFVGDSTFFHAGMPPLLDAIKEDADMVAVVLDNRVTAMTGFQESPGLPIFGQQERTASIADVCRALGAKHVEVFDPMDLAAAVGAFERARDATGTSVLVAEGPCPVHHRAESGEDLYPGPAYKIDQSLCSACGRGGCGLECDQVPVPATERAMARSRALDLERPPSEAVSVAPCATACPLGLCIQGYAGHIAAGRYGDALELITTRLPLPETVCRVCHRPCEDACARASLDGPVAINDLKRFVVEHEQGAHEPEIEELHGARVAIVGAGPAGLAAAHELRTRGWAATLFDRADAPGGLLRFGIPDFRLPEDALAGDVRRILALGVEFVGGRALGRDLRLGELLAEFDRVLLAVGAYRPGTAPLEEEGDGLPDRMDALPFLDEAGASAAGLRVVVIGGGNAGIDVARTAIRAGATQVRVVERAARIPALVHEAEAASQEGVELIPGFEPTALVGGADRGVRGHATDGTVDRLLGADLVVFAVGQQVEQGLWQAGDPEFEVGPGGTITVDPHTGSTSHPRVFAAGDVTPGPRTVTDAVAQGMRAAWGLDKDHRGDAADRRAPPPVPGWPDAGSAALPIVRADAGAPHRPPELPIAARSRSQEVVGVFSEAEAKAEAGRCMICGTCGTCRACLDTFGCPAFFVSGGQIQIDPTLCTGCGACASICPNGAIVPDLQARP
ncbi:MAG: FAD-dependent oxidoreductase [Proteobacteria bacterium]|nr:FAD-dependent oxidoreductase [Pseudomonadota bacterium]